VVAIFCGCLKERRRPTVFGDGTQTRDWVEVADVVRGNLLAADSTLTGAVNIGAGTETSILDLLAALNDADALGPMPEPAFGPERAGEVKHSCLDPGRARRELGWEVEVELREGLRRTLGSL
jgi:UDP-glucose 4-epimerase